MKKSHNISIVFFALFIFIFALVSEAYQVSEDPEEKGLILLKEGEQLYENLQYDEAINRYNEALNLLKSNENFIRCYLNMAKAYYALSNQIKTEEMLRRLFSIEEDKKIKVENYPKGFIRIYFDIQIEFTVQEKKPVVMEKEGKKKSKKITVWLIIAGAAVALGVLSYFLFIKKSGSPKIQYKLTVTKGNGVLGVPETGTYTYDEGQVINYEYSLEIDYLFYDLAVKLDGETAKASGNITMDKDHTLSASARGFWKKVI